MFTLALYTCTVSWRFGRHEWEIKVGRVAFVHHAYGCKFGFDTRANWRSSGMVLATDYGQVGYITKPGWRWIYTPSWMPLVLIAACPTLLFARGWLRRRSALEHQLRGRCVRCGYDTTGLPSPRCPECGTAIEPPRGGPLGVKGRMFRDVFLLCLLLGAVATVLILLVSIVIVFGITGPMSRGQTKAMLRSVAELPRLIPYAGLLALLWSAFVVPMLYRKPFARVFWTLLLVVTLGTPAWAGIASLVLSPPTSPLVYFLSYAPTLPLILTCLILWRVLPNVYPHRSRNVCRCELPNDTADLCPKCGGGTSG